ncbi:MAG: pyruvate carboxylase subunit B [Candidatus Delongbacteria bacterium]|nr:pyruvate carboxylase subunit B [Candidatus Delongbacteria bacterium]
MTIRSKTEKSKTNSLHDIPLRITDTTLRDAHQSIWATRMRTKDMLDIIDVIDNVGYYSLEMWGGATFDVCLRFLRENPWERLREIKKHAKNTPLQMLLRGQNIVGYKNYSDDVVDKFVELACKNGIDIFRIFDALNDVRNLEAAIKAVKKYGGHAQGTLAYTISPVHTIEKYVKDAKDQMDLGIDSICIKDMAGILSPLTAEKLVTALNKEIGIPIQLHCHGTSGMAIPAYVEGVRAGAGAIDCAISSMAGINAQPPVETLAAIFNETSYSANLDFDALLKVAKYFEDLKPKRIMKNAQAIETVDPGILIHQIPGGMISNFKSQLEIQNSLHKLPAVLDEVIKVRADLGYCPLVTPTSQIVGTQAVMNVLSGERYKIVPNEVKDYVRGKYGRSPVPLDNKFVKMILGKEKPIDHRPADDIKPMLPTIADELDPELIHGEEDIISYCIFPETAMAYFKWRSQPEDERDPVPADIELQEIERSDKHVVKEIKKNESEKKKPAKLLHKDDYKGLSSIISAAAGMNADGLTISKGDFAISIGADGIVVPQAAKKVETPQTPEETIVEEDIIEENIVEKSEHTNTINSPLVGTFYIADGPGKPELVKTGDKVTAGQKICIVEAMKLFNGIEAPFDCEITAVLCKDGDSVVKDQPLIAYKK